MIAFSTIKIAVRALRRNVLRTLLTMLGIIIGVGAVIAMVSIGNGAKAQVEARIASLGQNVVLVFSGDSRRSGVSKGFGYSYTLTEGDYEAIRREVTGIVGISPEVRTYVQAVSAGQNINTVAMGVGTEYLGIRSWALANGENFTELDVRNNTKVALIGATTAKTLFEDGDPVGQVVRLNNAPFTIVGKLAAKGMSMMGSDQDDVLLVPYTSAIKRLSRTTTIRSMSVQAGGPELLQDVADQITALLRQRHHTGGDKEDDFKVMTQEELSETFTATSKIMTLLLGSIAGVSLLVGGIGIMNIMLVSVTERTREIGVRMAVGARGRDILLQFLIEAVTLSLLGGIVGIGLGMATSRFLAAQFQWPTLISADSIILAFAFSAAIGIFFGFYPARKAAQLDPIEALRYE